jgi:hypothetical protein
MDLLNSKLDPPESLGNLIVQQAGESDKDIRRHHVWKNHVWSASFSSYASHFVHRLNVVWEAPKYELKLALQTHQPDTRYINGQH